MKDRSEKVVVFGGSGFLGSYVADALTEAGFEVTIYDLVKSPWIKKNQHIILGDILDEKAVDAACVGAKYVYNFAGIADINEAKELPEKTIQLNILGNCRILEACRKSGVSRFVYASSVYVYSDAGSFYRASKQACEAYTELYSQKYKLEYTILRYGSLYGVRADAKNNIYRFIQGALKNKRIDYKGSGDEVREYINAEDAAKASVEILDEKFKNQNIVLTGSQTMTIKDIMLMLTEMVGGDIKLNFENIDYEAHYNYTPYTFRPNLAKKLLVNPFIDLGQGLLECMHAVSQANGQEAIK